MSAYIIEDDVNRQLAARRQARHQRYPEEYAVADRTAPRGVGRVRATALISARLLDAARWLARPAAALRSHRG